eukprot:364901-Chlamydomonas_euryale.AAC.6
MDTVEVFGHWVEEGHAAHGCVTKNGVPFQTSCRVRLGLHDAIDRAKVPIPVEGSHRPKQGLCRSHGHVFYLVARDR